MRVNLATMARSLLIPAVAVGLGLALGASGLACAPRKPISEWAYSSWYHRSGASSRSEFNRRRDTCLERAAPDGDLEAVDEDGFRRCMNGTNWCTQRYQCRKP